MVATQGIARPCAASAAIRRFRIGSTLRRPQQVNPVPKPNYRFDKRQRELKKAKEQEEKRQKKLARSPTEDEAPTPASPEQAADAPE